MKKQKEEESSKEVNAFKRAQLRYRRQPDRPDRLDDITELLDFRATKRRPHLHPLIERVETTTNDSDDDCYHGPLYTIQGFEGFLYAPNALSKQVQDELAFEAVTQYCESPHPTNIDLIPPKPHEYNSDSKTTNNSLWNVWKHEQGFPSLQPSPLNNPSDDLDSTTPKTSRYKSFSKLSWAVMGYRYDWTNRVYSNDQSPIPVALQQLSKRFAAASARALNDISSPSFFQPEAAIVNYYTTKSIMGGHKDDSEFAVTKPIISFSLGRPAVFLLGQFSREEEPIVPLLIRPGDVMLMGGSTRLNLHAMARLLPNHHPDLEELENNDNTALPSSNEKQIASLYALDAHAKSIPDNERAAIDHFLSLHRININLRQVYPEEEGDNNQERKV